MKKFDVNSGNSSTESPWRPWGGVGVLWRYLLFLLLLALFCLYLFNVKSCDSSHSSWDDYIVEYPDAVEIPEYVVEDYYVEYGIETPFDGNIANPDPALPTPEDNRIYDVIQEEIITNPDNPYKQIVSIKLNVILNSDATDETYNKFAQEFKQLYPEDDCKINYYNSITKMMQLTVPESKRKYIHDNLNSQIPDIDFKIFYEEVFAASASAKDYNDPSFKNQKESWYFAPIQAFDAWEVTKGDENIIVAVIDNFVDITHPEFEGRVVKPYSVDKQSGDVLPPPGFFSFEDPSSSVFHGTHVAATAVGALDNGQGAAGIAPKCKLMPVSLGDQMTSMKILDGLLYAVNQGADVVNLSLQNFYPETVVQSPVQEQINYAREEGKYVQEIWDYVFKLADERNCTIVWAGGNQNIIVGMDEFKRNPNTLRVSAVDPTLRRADFSNYGLYENLDINYSDVSAPGVDIYNAGPNNTYGYSDGTSMAAPIVTGAVALMKSLNPNLTNEEVIKIIKETSRPLPTADHAGGLLQIRSALDKVSGTIANFDEIKNDNSKILGRWESTERLPVTRNGEYTGNYTLVTLDFSSVTGGTITYSEDTGHNYTASFKSKIYDDRIEVEQLQYAHSRSTDEYYEKMKFTGTRGSNGQLECHRPPKTVFYLVRK